MPRGVVSNEMTPFLFVNIKRIGFSTKGDLQFWCVCGRINTNILHLLKRIVRDCNYAVLDKNPDAKVLLPPFSCHILRHTFTTRLCEAGVNVKVIQDTLGHADISTTVNVRNPHTNKM